MAPPSTPDSFPTSEMFNTLIRVEVGTGDPKRTFDVFRGVLCFYSGYFDSALNGRFREATDGVVTLPTEDPLIFELFRCWIFTRRFFESTLEPRVLFDYLTLAKLWVFGDAHQVPLLQNVVADILAEKMMVSVTAPDPETLDFIYENTVQGSRLRHTINQSVRFMDDPDDPHSVELVWDDEKWEVDSPENLKYVLATQNLVQASVPMQESWLHTLRCDRHVHAGVKCAL